MKKLDIMSPGKRPARKSLPTDWSAMAPYTMKKILGGIRIPRVPPAATEPRTRPAADADQGPADEERDHQRDGGEQDCQPGHGSVGPAGDLAKELGHELQQEEGHSDDEQGGGNTERD